MTSPIGREPLISVIIPAHCTDARHGTSRLRLALHSLCRAGRASSRSYEVILVDNASDPPLDRQVESWGLAGSVRTIRREEKGFASGYNVGISAARAPLTLLSTDDELASPGMLDKHIAVQSDAPPTLLFGHCMTISHTQLFRDVTTAELVPAALAQAATRGESSWLPGAMEALELASKPITVDDVVHRFERVEALACTMPQMEDIERTVASGRAHALPGGWLATRVGNHSVRTDFLRDVGGFDESLDDHGGWYSDLDLGLRLADAGAEFRYTPEAVSVNLSHPRSPGSMLGTVSGMTYMLAKHRRLDVALSPLYFQHHMPLMGFAGLLRRAAKHWPKDTGIGLTGQHT